MEPNNHNYQPSGELLQPQEVGGVQGAEAQPSAPEQSTQPPATPAGQQPLQSVTATPPPQTPAPIGAAQPQGQPVATGTGSLIADDVDLIEKEWVVKAKAIVAQTKDDPYQQNRAMSQVKADYMKKRYNKDLKVNSET